MSKEKFIEALSSTGRKGLDTVIAKLEESGFFDAPASSKFHLSCKGGLMEHSMNVYEAALFVREGLGYQLTFRNLVDVSAESGLVFRPLFPKKETKLYLIWNRYQAFTPIAERFLAQVRSSFCPTA